MPSGYESKRNSVLFSEENVPTASFKGQLSFSGVKFQDHTPGFQLKFILRGGFKWVSGLSSWLRDKRCLVACDR
jgi:hypothetical protein